ncbi:hypothetical protein [Gryllotalpicola kribbensis]|uniref:hypothetical protein n=1 Tax=Gryllotalpicola kribbensis TaxID=993084 RepID=UPI0031D38249
MVNGPQNSRTEERSRLSSPRRGFPSHQHPQAQHMPRAAARCTQSNSVGFVKDGAASGLGARQQNRVDRVRLAGAKARICWLCRHSYACELSAVAGLKRQDWLDWQVCFAEQEMTRSRLTEFSRLFDLGANGTRGRAGVRNGRRRWCRTAWESSRAGGCSPLVGLSGRVRCRIRLLGLLRGCGSRCY